MTAPVATARGTPAGIMLANSYPVRVTFARNPTISFWEKELQPPGLDGGEKIDQTTQFNTHLRTNAPRALSELTPIKGKAAYDPNVLTQIYALINTKDTITFTFSDGTTVAFYGYLRMFTPANQAGDGTQPEADFEIQPTMADPTTGAEETFVLVNVAGT